MNLLGRADRTAADQTAAARARFQHWRAFLEQELAHLRQLDQGGGQAMDGSATRQLPVMGGQTSAGADVVRKGLAVLDEED